jgi:hypothetical protein
VAEIIASLAKSPEGRVLLAVIAAGLGFLYLRFHYIEEGRAEGMASVKPAICAPAPPPTHMYSQAPRRK